MIRILLIALMAVGLTQQPEARTPGQKLKDLTSIGQDLSAMADNSRSDTIDILKYTINLSILDFTGKTIAGNCAVQFSPKLNGIASISLDLLKMTIDSVTSGGSQLTYSYNDTLLNVTLPTTLNSSDTSTVTVYYNGAPQGDASGWGGFYFQTDYAFNLGVGFAADPHNYGRVWFPCFDNFIERSQFEFNITTSGGKIAACNGELVNEVTVSGDTIMRTWVLTDEIPTYLACVAVAPYTVVNQTHIGISDTIPIQLFAKPGDTVNLKNSFINLGGAIDAFESSYGPFQWNKVGFSLVLFNSGAMEHATNVAYPRYAADGTLGNETLMAHELSHHWWGDLATCETAEDMWINEGMAVFSEHIFLENVYDWDTYINEVKSNHLDVIRFAHVRDSGYRAISGVPHAYTYGNHVYNKGASVAHSMRGYLGDSLFFAGLTSVLANKQFSPVNSYEFRDEMTAATGVDMTDFFNSWVFNPGFPHFAIDSFKVTGGGPYIVTVYIRQKLKAAPSFFNNVPMEVSFMDAGWTEQTENITISGEFSNFSFTLPFDPVYVTLNKQNLINHAVTDDQVVLTTTGLNTLVNGMMNITVDNITDSALIRVEHHWAAADPIKNTDSLKMMISPYRYWRVDGILPALFDATARIIYDGRIGTPGNTGYLDDVLLSGTNEDSLHLLYRKGPQEDWQEFGWYTKNDLGTATDAYGMIFIDSLLLGEYALAVDQYNVGIETVATKGSDHFKLYPNPNNGNMQLEYSLEDGVEGQLCIFGLNGRLIECHQMVPGSHVLQINQSHLNSGLYLYSIEAGQIRQNGKFEIIR